MIKNREFKNFIENIIKNYTSIFISNIDNFKKIFSSLSPKTTINKIRMADFKRYQTQNEKVNNHSSLSENKKNSKSQNEKKEYDEKKFLSPNKYNCKKTEKTTDKFQNSLIFKN